MDGAALRATRCHGLLLALRALFAFMPIASMHLVAQASEMELARGVGSLSQQETPAADASLIEPAHYRASRDTPPACELNALEPQDAERDVGLDTRASEPSPSLTPISPFAMHVMHGAPALWRAQFTRSSALPRGPPACGRGVDAPTSRTAC